MNREQKKLEIESLKESFTKASLCILTDYQGLKVNEVNTLRQKLSKSGSHFKIVKNRLAKIALTGGPQEFLKDFLKGTTALTSTSGDPVGVAKVLVEFSKDREQMKFKTASMGGKVLTQKELEALAKLPGRHELIAKLLGSMQAPARNWVCVLAQIPRQWVNVLAAVRDQKEKRSE